MLPWIPIVSVVDHQITQDSPTTPTQRSQFRSRRVQKNDVEFELILLHVVMDSSSLRLTLSDGFTEIENQMDNHGPGPQFGTIEFFITARFTK